MADASARRKQRGNTQYSSSPEVGDGLSNMMRAIIDFHEVFGLPLQSLPDARLDPDLARLRVDLLVEEVGELADATREQDVVAVADALGDVVYAAYGAAITYGIDLDAVLLEVHRANMSKLDADGHPVFDRNGKVAKSPEYRPPDVAGVLAVQQPLPVEGKPV